ncbi:MAG: polysaccharide deacetylase family protein [Candidatus Sulfotelmatobacter sp.]
MPRDSIVFLMFHELEIAGRPLCQADPGYVRYVLREVDFRAQMDYLKVNGWQGLSVGQALEFSEGHNVAITFDDGSATDLLMAAPTLQQTKFNATFFITCGRLGKPGYLSIPQLKELGCQGFEIGCHSMTHPYLTDLDESGLRYEICDAKTQLEQIMGQPVEHFSCPGGRCDDRVVAMARAAGYKTLSTSRIQANSRMTDTFSLGRVAIMRDMSLAAFSGICSGSSLPRMRSQSMFRSVARKVLGNSFYDRMRATLLRR